MEQTSNTEEKLGNVGILVGGGPSPAINGVIAAVTIAAKLANYKVYGFYDGYKWLVKGDEELLSQHVKELQIADVERIHFQGGSILRTSRTNPAKTEHGVENAVAMLKKYNIRYMVTIGGDDTAYGASQIAEATHGSIKFAHVPKTIDNDLPLPYMLPTFGYQTARELGTTLVKNLMEDAKTTDRWYCVVAMGRTAGHLTLGITKASGATLAIIPEEFGIEQGKKISLKQVCDIFETAIIKRRALGFNSGVMVIAEGISEFLNEEDLNSIMSSNSEECSFGHIQLADVELGKILKQEIERRFQARGEKFRVVTMDIGYVLRCSDPIPFDQEYTRDLGNSAFQYLMDDTQKENAMICVNQGDLEPLYFKDMIDPVTKKTKVRRVNINSNFYKTARNYMIRLEKRDFSNKELLAKMAKIANMTPEEFTERYSSCIL